MKLLSRYENMRFQKKLFLVFGISFVFCILVVMIFLTSYSSRLLFENNISNLQIISSQAAVDFDRRRSDTENQLFQKLTMLEVADYVAAVNKDDSDYRKRELQYKVAQLVSNNAYFDYVCLETDQGYYCDTADKLTTGNIQVREFAEESLEEGMNNTPNTGYLWISDDENRIWLIHSIRQISTLDHVGWIIARIRSEAFDMINDSENGIGLIFYDNKKQCILIETSSTEICENLRDDIREDRLLLGLYDVGEEEYYVVESQVLTDGWNIIGIIPISNIYRMITQIRWMSVLLVIAALLSGCVLMNYLTRKISRQILALSDAIGHVAKGEIGIQAPIYMHDDIGEIASCFNEMSTKNKSLIEDIISAEKQKNNAQMEAIDYKYRYLHTQISPHFIYNSLETINAIAKVNHTPEVSRIVQLIGKYFRGITKYADVQFIELSEELEQLDCLIEIYRVVREDNLSFQIECPEEFLGIQIPTMILQPIIENSFVHGIRGVHELFIIHFRVFREEDNLVITVSDNGAGVDEAVLRELENGERMQNSRKRIFSGIGLSNIRERLRMLYGEKAGLTISNGAEGAVTTIYLPLCYEVTELRD